MPDESNLPALGDTVIEWPTAPGIWMGWLDDIWFPFKARLLKEYPPEVPHLPMPIVAQFPQSATNWPFTFQGCHPVKRWRPCTPEEAEKARKFYGIEANPD